MKSLNVLHELLLNICVLFPPKYQFVISVKLRKIHVSTSSNNETHFNIVMITQFKYKFCDSCERILLPRNLYIRMEEQLNCRTIQTFFYLPEIWQGHAWWLKRMFHRSKQVDDIRISFNWKYLVGIHSKIFSRYME